MHNISMLTHTCTHTHTHGNTNTHTCTLNCIQRHTHAHRHTHHTYTHTTHTHTNAQSGQSVLHYNAVLTNEQLLKILLIDFRNKRVSVDVTNKVKLVYEYPCNNKLTWFLIELILNFIGELLDSIDDGMYHR